MCSSLQVTNSMCIYSINMHLHTQLIWGWAWMQWGECFSLIHIICAGQFSALDCMDDAKWISCMPWSCPSVCQAWTAYAVVGREPMHFTVFYLKLKVVTETISGFLHSCLFSVSIRHKICGKCCTCRHRSFSKYSVSQSYSLGHVFLDRGRLSVSFKPVCFQFLAPSHSTHISPPSLAILCQALSQIYYHRLQTLYKNIRAIQHAW